MENNVILQNNVEPGFSMGIILHPSMNRLEVLWTREEMIEAINSSCNIQQALDKLHHINSSGHYKTFHKYVYMFGLNIDHFDPYIGKRKTKRKETPLSEVMNDNSTFSPKTLKERLIRDGYFKYECSICQTTEWQNKPIVLQMDHINGNRLDNRFENLRLLCPNCHSQTPTFTGKNNRWAKERPVLEDKFCSCGRKMLQTSKVCGVCAPKLHKTKIVWPPTDDLINRVIEKGFVKAAESLGVSDNAIRKRFQRLNINPKDMLKTRRESKIK